MMDHLNFGLLDNVNVDTIRPSRTLAVNTEDVDTEDKAREAVPAELGDPAEVDRVTVARAAMSCSSGTRRSPDPTVTLFQR